MKTHNLKCDASGFQDVMDNLKLFEYRKMDREFAVDDRIRLKEVDFDGDYTGRMLQVRIRYILNGGLFGIPEGYCIMSLDSLTILNGYKVIP